MNLSAATKVTSVDSPSICWPMLCRVRLAIHDLQACQSLVLQGKPACFAALIDAQALIKEAVELAIQQMQEAAQ